MMFVVCGFRESMYVFVIFRCIEFSLWSNHWYDYHNSSFWLLWFNHCYDYHYSSFWL